ncbi:fimbrial protein [Pantoea vagans]|uniref:fimbrial protein n=1 Tax=Pantoea vagans TaxID=470934 RepID=UPI0023AF1307|nr:fimbrial protein [Pantoea vagans]MDE8554992.1 fimbrial protein [Pantoea vagans]MDE8575042.1 fimbrial protein [Pantoea vagans]
MKMKIRSRSLAVLVSSALVSGSVFAASDNTINFQGEVTAETCSVSVNGNNASPVVLLPTVSTSDLATSGTTAGDTNFTVGVSGCTGDSSKTTKISTVFVGNNVSAAGNLTNTGTAKNVEVQILDPKDAVINLTSGYAGSGDMTLQAGETSGSATYSARYYAAGTPTAGTVTASLQYAVTYQ